MNIPHEILRDDETIILKGNIVIDVNDFKKRFEGVDFNYKSLTSHVNCKGSWKKYFDKWKEDGILN